MATLVDRLKYFPMQVLIWEGGSGRESVETSLRQPRRYAPLIWRLTACTVILLLAVGATYEWQQELHEENHVVNIIARATWTLYAIAQLALVVLLLIAAFRAVARRRG